jgi:hypothetical protein
MPTLPLILLSDLHVFEPPDLWQTRIDAAFRERVPRIERIDGGDHVVVQADQVLSGIGLISNAAARFAAPETISAEGALRRCAPRGYDPGNTSRTWRSMGWRTESSIPRRVSYSSSWRTRR